MSRAAFNPEHSIPPSPPPAHVIRDAIDGDFAAILRLNRDSEAALSPLTLPRLQALSGQAWYHRVACRAGSVQAFLIALRPGADYDSPNYRWFCARYTDFVYVDRIVVHAGARQAGLATLLYDDLIRRAQEHAIGRITCEFDIDPPNEASRRFHARFGFVEVGTQLAGGGSKRVSLQARKVQAPPAVPAGEGRDGAPSL